MIVISEKNHLFQWDIQQRMLVNGADYIDYIIDTEVVRIRCIDGECIIPDEILKNEGIFRCWACTDTGTRTEYTFTVKGRPMPPDYVYTPTQRETFDQLVERVDLAANEAMRAADNAQQTAEAVQRMAIEGDFDGADGYSPSAKVERTTNGVKVSVTDKDGTTEAEVHDGTDAKPYDDTELRRLINAEASTRLTEDARVLAEAKVETAKKVGYSEVKDGKLLMYSDDTKAVLLAEMDLPVYDDSKIRKELDDKVGDVQVNGSSIVSEGVANVPIGGYQKLGVMSTYPSRGTVVSGDGTLYLNNATETEISARYQYEKPLIPKTLDHAVKAALTDGKGTAYTEAEQLAARQRIGIDKQWTLKGTLTTENKDTGVNVDLTGCTELFIKGYAQATSAQSLYLNAGSYTFWDSAINTAKRFYRYYGKVNSADGYCMTIYSKFSTSQNYINSNFNVNDRMTLKLEDVNKILFASNNTVTDCNLEIYAR